MSSSSKKTPGDAKNQGETHHLPEGNLGFPGIRACLNKIGLQMLKYPRVVDEVVPRAELTLESVMKIISSGKFKIIPSQTHICSGAHSVVIERLAQGAVFDPKEFFIPKPGDTSFIVSNTNIPIRLIDSEFLRLFVDGSEPEQYCEIIEDSENKIAKDFLCATPIDLEAIHIENLVDDLGGHEALPITCFQLYLLMTQRYSCSGIVLNLQDFVMVFLRDKNGKMHEFLFGEYMGGLVIVRRQDRPRHWNDHQGVVVSKVRVRH